LLAPGRRERTTKVPEITPFFWILKLLTTAMGEATSDYLVSRFNPYLGVAIGGIFFVIVLALQFYVPRYIPWVYWLAVMSVAIFGTMAADTLHVQFGIPFVVTTSFFAIVLAAVFLAWDRVEKTLSIHSITTPRRELFYWLTVSATFALGTAAGDLVATTFKLGYLDAGILFAALVLIPAVAYWRFHVSEVLAFWFAYVLTRPIGASFADWSDKPHIIGGLNLGDGPVAIGLTLAIIALVAVVTILRVDLQSSSAAEGQISPPYPG
jgi:uncharacterized membrane-anchored protein